MVHARGLPGAVCEATICRLYNSHSARLNTIDSIRHQLNCKGKKSMEKVKVALIGAGTMANTMHYPSLARFADVSLVGLCDIDSAKAKTTAAAFGIAKTYTDYRIMLNETKPDAVYVLLPPHIIFDVAMDILDQGHHLFIEKPPAVTTFQTEAMARLAVDRRRITAVGFQRRYHPMLHDCFDRVRGKAAIQQVVARYYKNLPPTEVHPYYRGAIDILHCDAIHAVDALRYYAGLSEVVSVASDISNLDCWYGVRFNAIVKFANGVGGCLLLNWRSGRRFLTFEFHANGIAAFVDTDGEGTVWADNADTPLVKTTVEEFSPPEPFIANGIYAENRSFIDAVKSGNELHNNLADAVKTMRLADMILKA